MDTQSRKGVKREEYESNHRHVNIAYLTSDEQSKIESGTLNDMQSRKDKSVSSNTERICQTKAENSYASSNKKHLSYVSFHKNMKIQSGDSRKLNIAKSRNEANLALEDGRTANCHKHEPSSVDTGSRSVGSRRDGCYENGVQRSVGRLLNTKSHSQDLNHQSFDKELVEKSENKRKWSADNDSRRSRSRSCSPRDSLEGRLAVRRRLPPKSREFVMHDRSFLNPSGRNCSDNSELQRSGSRNKWWTKQQRRFRGSGNYMGLDREQSFHNKYSDCPDFEDDDMARGDSYDRHVDLPARMHDRSNQTYWSNRSDERSSYDSSRQWRYREACNRFTETDENTGEWELARTSDIDRDHYERNCPRSPRMYSSTGFQRRKWKDNVTLSSRRLPVRNRLGWNKPDFNPSVRANEYCNDCDSDIRYQDSINFESRRNKPDSFLSPDNFKLPVDARSERGNAIGRRTGRKFSYFKKKRTIIERSRDGGRFLRGCNVSSLRDGGKEQLFKGAVATEDKSDPDLECVVSESLSKIRRNAEFSGPESSDDAATLKHADKMSKGDIKLRDRDESEERLTSLIKGRAESNRKRILDQTGQKLPSKENNCLSNRSLSCDKQIFSGLVCHTSSLEPGSEQTARDQLVPDKGQSKVDLIADETVKSAFFETKHQGNRRNSFTATEGVGRKDRNCEYVINVNCSNSPQTPTCDEICTPSPLEVRSVDMELDPQNFTDHSQTARPSVDHLSNTTVESSSQVVWPAYTAIVNRGTVSNHLGTQFESGVQPSCANSSTPWNVREGSARYESASSRPELRMRNQLVGAIQPSHGLLQTVFRSDWPTAADQQMPLYQGVPSGPVTGPLPPTSVCFAPLPNLDSSSCNVLNAVSQSRTTFPHTNGFQSAECTEASVYGDSPLLDEPDYNSPVAVVDACAGAAVHGTVLQDGVYLGGTRAGGLPVQRASVNVTMSSNRSVSEGSEENPKTVRPKQERV
jgi:hypothetical protein